MNIDKISGGKIDAAFEHEPAGPAAICKIFIMFHVVQD